MVLDALDVARIDPMATRVPNPYRPGFNQAPAALAGRDSVLEAVAEALDVAALDGRTPRPLVLTGGRGVGKTVILGEAAAIAATEHSWLTVPIEIRPERPFTTQLLERLAAARDLYRQAPPGKQIEVTAATIKASVLGIGGEVEVRRRATSTPEPALPLDAALAEVCEAALEHDAGLLITIDELQLAAKPELGDFAATLQQHVPDAWPLVVIVAGLPSIRDTQRGVTYFERGEWHVLGPLDTTSTRLALEKPADDAGRPMTADAVDQLATASGGYPYAIQLLGHHAWRASKGSDAIAASHVPAAIDATQSELAAGLYESRWQDASPKEREYLAALAELSATQDHVTGSEVAHALGTQPKAVSYVRDRLIRKGTIYTEAERVRLAVPGMAQWIRR